VPVNLNFTLGDDAMDSAIANADYRNHHIAAFPRQSQDRTAQWHALYRGHRRAHHEVRKTADSARRLSIAGNLLVRRYGLRRQSPQDPATVLFSSGSTGKPKGVVLSHHAILSNVEGVGQVLWVAQDDKMLASCRSSMPSA